MKSSYNIIIIAITFFICAFHSSLSQTIEIPEEKDKEEQEQNGEKLQDTNTSSSGNVATIYIPRRERIERAVDTMDKKLKSELKEKTEKKIEEEKITDDVKTNVKAEVEETENEEGEKELNLNLEYEYQVVKAKIENQTDDYPPGEYNLTKSNAAKMTMTTLKQTVEDKLAEYLGPEKKVTIKITGSTDAMPIEGTIPYNKEYGNFHNEFCFINGSLDNITITQEQGITTNAQLAFLRTYGVRRFIEKFVGPLSVTENKYEHYAKVADERGAKYRRISVEMTIHNAFEGKFQDKEQQKDASPKKKHLSDVDKNIPESGIAKKNTYAVVIGNEDYTSYQKSLQTEANVDYAKNDALVFADYLEKTLGLPEDNITSLTNATGSQMKSAIDKLSKLAQYSDGKAKLIFYYAGHGLPHESTKIPYIMPVDVSAANITEGIKLSSLYNTLTEHPAKKVTVFLDACFSGGGREQGLLSARGVKIQPKENALRGNIVVFSASSGEQTALPFEEKKHGMFTYYLLKKIQKSKGKVTYKELSDYIKQKVEINAIKYNSKEQNPKVRPSYEIDEEWKDWRLR